jgi:hypothetical protein
MHMFSNLWHFSDSQGEVTLFLTLDEGFVEKDKWGGYEPKIQFYGIESDEFNHFDRLCYFRIKPNCSL